MLRWRRWSVKLCLAVTLLMTDAWSSILAHAQETRSGGVTDPAARAERAHELTTRGQRLIASGNSGSAVWYLREALSIDRRHAAAAVALADLYLVRGEPSAAHEVVATTLKHAPGSGALWLRLVNSHLALNDEPGARTALLRGLDAAPRDPELLHGLAEMSMKRGEWLRALQAHRALARLDRTVSADLADVEAALMVIVGSTDRARGTRCDATLSTVRRALSRCPPNR